MSELPGLGLVSRMVLGLVLRIMLGMVLRMILRKILRMVLSKLLVCNWTKRWHTVARQVVAGASTIVQSTCRTSSGGLFIKTNMTGG